MPRDLKTLLLDGETPATLRAALESLDELEPTTPKWVRDILENRTELLQELETIGAQGRLF